MAALTLGEGRRILKRLATSPSIVQTDLFGWPQAGPATGREVDILPATLPVAGPEVDMDAKSDLQNGMELLVVFTVAEAIVILFRLLW